VLLVSDEQEDYTRSFVTRSDIDKEAAWEVNKKKIEKPGYVYIRHTSDEYVSGIRNASDGVAWGASQLNLKDLKGAVGAGADYDDTDIQRELAAQAKRIEANEDNISDLDKNKENVGHTHDDLVTGDHDHEQYQPKGDYATKAELSTGLSGKADDPHTHDYAADDHDHDTVYQPKGDYATGDHGHDDYETKVDAELVHEALTESIAGKADDDHDHSGIYSPFDHGHENLATDDHAHDEYQPKGDYADSVHIHTEYAETGDIEELSAAIAEEAKDRANADSILQDQVTANKESIEALGEKGYDDTWIQPALDKKSDDPHTHDDLASGDHTHDEYLTSSDLPEPYDDTQVKLDIKTNADAIAEIQSNGYDDTQIREDFAAADADTLSSANDYTDEKIGAIPDPVPYDDTQVKQDIQANKESIEALGEKGYDDTGVKKDIATNAENIAANAKAIEEIVVPDVSDFVTSEELSTGLSGKADEPHTHDEYLTDLTHDHDGTYQPVGDYATNDALSTGLSGKSDTTHSHDEYLTDLTHDHDGTYQPAGDYATKTELSDGLAGKEDAGHTHDDYTSKDYVDNQDREWDKVAKGYTDDAVKNHTHDDYLTDLPTHDHPHGHDEYQPKGDYATKEDLKGKEDVGHTHDTAHDHEEYANVEELEKLKGEIIDIEAELEAIAPNREKGDWEATDTGAPRPGQANLANPSFTAEQNILVINQVDANDETHTFNEVEEGDNIEIAVDENNLGLYEVGPSTRSDVVNLNLTLIKGQGSIKAGDQIKINIFGLADTNLNLEELDERYLQLSGGTMTGDLSAPNIALSGVGDKSIKENDNNRIKFGGKVIITRGDSNNAEGFEIKGKTANGSNDHLLSVYHNSSGIDAINYYGKQDGNENIATVKHVKDKIDGHTHEMPTHNHDERSIRKDEDTNLTHTTDHRFTNIKSQQAKNAEGVNDTSEPWGIHFDLDAGNSWKNQFQVGTSRHGYALQVNGGSGKEVWIGGSISQKDGDLTNPKDENYITRKNLDEHNHDGQYLPSGDWPEDQPEMSGAEIMDWSMTMFNLNDVNQKLQDAAIAQKAEIDHTHEGVGAEHTHDEYVAKSGSTMSGMLTINKDSNVLFTGKKAGETTIQVWADGTVKQLETNGNSDPECLVNRQNLTNEIKKLENRIDALEPEPEPDAEITLTMEMGSGSNGRPTGSGASEGKIAVWYLYPEGTTSPNNEAKLHMGPDALDANIWTTVTEMHLIQGNKKQVWKVNPPWITGGDNNVLHASSNDIKGDTLTVDAETRILFFGPNFPPVEDETEEEESFIKTITLPGFTRSSFYDENSFFAKNSSGVAAVPFQSSKVFITSTRDDPYGLEKVATSMVAVAIGTFLIIREDNGRCVMSWKLGQMRTEGNGTLEIERGEELTADGGWGPTDSTYTLVLKDV
jgi:hypothetical protein